MIPWSNPAAASRQYGYTRNLIPMKAYLALCKLRDFEHSVNKKRTQQSCLCVCVGWRSCFWHGILWRFPVHTPNDLHDSIACRICVLFEYKLINNSQTDVAAWQKRSKCQSAEFMRTALLLLLVDFESE